MAKKGKQKRQLIGRLTAKDFKWTPYKGSGPGGQHRNKTMTGMRCTHPPSGAVGQSCDTKSQHQNKKLAFRRMAETKEFQKWARVWGLKKIGVLDRIEAEIDQSLANPKDMKVETFVDGKWIPMEMVSNGNEKRKNYK